VEHIYDVPSLRAGGASAMPSKLDLVDTIVILMMENRSFDHMLGYLSLAKYGARKDVNGLSDDQAWLDKVANDWQGQQYWPIPLHPRPSA
jgi:phospholipase C